MGKLEAIVIPVTSSEINTNKFKTFIEQFKNIDGENLDMLIVINNSNYKHADISIIFTTLKNFKLIRVIELNIPERDDIYTHDPPSPKEYIPMLGSISGPNIMFFYSMKICKKYDTVLLLETDCFVKKNIINVASEYIRNTDFLISGSKYLGTGILDDSINGHLNGVAFYRTGSPEFWKLIDNTENFIKKEVKQNRPIIPYDVAIFLYTSTIPDTIYHSFILKKYITNKLILNFSTSIDSVLSIKHISLKYPDAVIIHKKINDTDKHYLNEFQ